MERIKTLQNLLIAVFLLFAINAGAQWNFNGNHIHNSNSENVGIGTSNPLYLLDVAKSMTSPTIAVRNLGGIGGAGFRMIDQNSNSDWRLKSTASGGFKIRDESNSLNVMNIENNASENSIYIKTGGNIGIGTSTPANLLEVAKNMTGLQVIAHNLGGVGGAGFTMIDDLNNGYWKFKSAGGNFKIRDQVSSMDVLVIEKNAIANALYIKAGGNIGIGIDNPTSKLAVNGKIDCKEVEIFLTGWSDYVFNEDYQLKSLSELEAYINKNKHLPDVPTEEDVIRNGIKIGEMNAILLEKIEELTLYIIDMKKENEEMKKQIRELMEK